MLSVQHLLNLNDVYHALVKHGETGLADAVKDILTTQQAARAKRRASAGTGRPCKVYAIAVQPGGTWHAQGMRAAHKIVKEKLIDLGAGQQCPASAASLGAMVARAGHWATLVDTVNGTLTITVQPA